MLLTGFIILFLGLIIYLLFAPIVFYLNTSTSQYYLQIQGLGKATIEKHHEALLRIKLSVLFFKFYFYPLKKRTVSKAKKLNKSTKKKIKKRIGIRKILNVLKSLKVKKLLVDVDMGDSILNSKLYPLFALLNYKIGKFNVNFQGRNKMELLVKSRPISIIKSFINH